MDAFEVQALILNHIAAGTLPRHMGGFQGGGQGFQPRGGQQWQDRGQQFGGERGQPGGSFRSGGHDRADDGEPRATVKCAVCGEDMQIRQSSLAAMRPGQKPSHKRCREGGAGRSPFGQRPVTQQAAQTGAASTAAILDRVAEETTARTTAAGSGQAATAS